MPMGLWPVQISIRMKYNSTFVKCLVDISQARTIRFYSCKILKDNAMVLILYKLAVKIVFIHAVPLYIIIIWYFADKYSNLQMLSSICNKLCKCVRLGGFRLAEPRFLCSFVRLPVGTFNPTGQTATMLSECIVPIRNKHSVRAQASIYRSLVHTLMRRLTVQLWFWRREIGWARLLVFIAVENIL